MSNFFYYLNNAFTGAVAVLVIFALQFFWWTTSPDYKVSMWILNLIVVVVIITAAFGYAVIRYLFDRSALNTKIKVLHCGMIEGRVVLVVEGNPLLKYGMVVTVFRVDAVSGTQARAAIGYVENIPTDRSVQVAGLICYTSFEVAVSGRKISPNELFVVPSVDRDCFTE